MLSIRKKIYTSICRLALVSLLIVSAFILMPRYTEAKSSSWKKIYTRFLNKHSLDFEEVAYARLDEDNTPEMITSDGDIYTIKRSKVRKLSGNASSYTGYYWDQGNCFYWEETEDDYYKTCYFTIENGEVSLYKKFICIYADGDRDNYAVSAWYIDNDEVTEEEYNEEFDRIQDEMNDEHGYVRTIDYNDYTRCHYTDRKTRRYEADTDDAKFRIEGNKLIVKGSMRSSLGTDGNQEDIPGYKHVFRLTAMTRYTSGGVQVLKSKMKRDLKIKGQLVRIDTNRKGKVRSIITADTQNENDTEQ